MIGDIFLNFVYVVVASLIGFLPQSQGFPETFHQAMLGIGGYFGMFSPLIPIDILLTCVTIIFTVEIAVFGFRTLKWVISHLPMIGGRG